MTERHGGWIALRAVPATTGHPSVSDGGRRVHRAEWKTARNGMPEVRPYEWQGVRSTAAGLAAIRQVAAARCGLGEYPAELVALSESLEQGAGLLPPAEQEPMAKRYRRLRLAAQREQAASEGGTA